MHQLKRRGRRCGRLHLPSIATAARTAALVELGRPTEPFVILARVLVVDWAAGSVAVHGRRGVERRSPALIWFGRSLVVGGPAKVRSRALEECRG